MVTVSATYSPHKGHSLTCHHLLCICKNLSPSEVPRDRDSIFFFSGPVPGSTPINASSLTRRQSLLPKFISLNTFTYRRYFTQRNHAGNLPSESGVCSSLYNCKPKSPSVPESHDKNQSGVCSPQVRKGGHSCHHQFSSVTQSCQTLCDPMDYSMPGLPVRRALQARILE